MNRTYGCFRCSGTRFIEYNISTIYCAMKKVPVLPIKVPCPACNPNYKDQDANYVKDLSTSKWRSIVKLNFDNEVIVQYPSMASCIKAHNNMSVKDLNELVLSGYSTKFGGKFKFATETHEN